MYILQESDRYLQVQNLRLARQYHSNRNDSAGILSVRRNTNRLHQTTRCDDHVLAIPSTMLTNDEGSLFPFFIFILVLQCVEMPGI